MLRFSALLSLFLLASPLAAQEVPASANLLTLGPIDGESDQKSSVITLRYDSKPGFQKPVVEAHGSFLQIVLPNTTVLKPGVFQEANSPYIRKFAPFQLDEDTAALRLFVSKEAQDLQPAVSVDILENRVLVILDHEKAAKAVGPGFAGVPVTGGPSPDQVVKQTAVRSDVPDPISIMDANTAPAASAAGPQEAPVAPKIGNESETVVNAASAAAVAKTQADLNASPAPATTSADTVAPINAASPRWSDDIESKMIAVTIFCALMLGIMIALKSWRRVASKTVPPGTDFSVKTLATHVLGPKQKITVVQVGSEQILLGVSQDSINFLTSLRPQTETAGLARMSVDPAPYQQTLTPTPKRPALREGAEPLARPTAPQNRAEPRPSASADRAERRAEPGSSIRYGVGDEGIKNFKGRGATAAPANDDSSLEDVTRLIRKKLKDLPKV